MKPSSLTYNNKCEILTSTLFIIYFVCFAQGQNNIWQFGDKAGLDFNYNPPIPISGALNTPEGCASISTPGGQLLFYTDGRTVFNKNHHPMPNGLNLDGGESSTQSALILPLPLSSNLYYIFTTQHNGLPGRLSYSVVNIENDGGLGDIDPFQKNILIESETTEKLTSAMHSNGIDIWVIAHRLNSNEFISYLLSPTGLSDAPIVSPIGSIYSSNDQSNLGYMKTSLSGSKLAITGTITQIMEVFDFNISTGTIKNYIDLSSVIGPEYYIYGLEFSQSECFLYASSPINKHAVLQIDLSDNSYSVLFEGSDVFLGAMQLAPDGRIYVAKNFRNTLDVINFPDHKGVQSVYCESCIILDSATQCLIGLPNMASFYNISNFSSYSLLDSTLTICRNSTESISVHFPFLCTDFMTHILWSNGATSTSIQVDQDGLYWVEVGIQGFTFRDTINVIVNDCDPIIRFDLEECESYLSNGSNMDYSEFIPAYPFTLQCGTITASNLFRLNEAENKHSCTTGIGDSIAMCISSNSSCEFINNHEASLSFEVSLNPNPLTSIHITKFSIYQKAPQYYSWINGATGLNNYPQYYGVTIQINNTIVFQEEGIKTDSLWKFEEFIFSSNPDFIIKDSTKIIINLLPYCPVGNLSTISAWDIDRIEVFGHCLEKSSDSILIYGKVLTLDNTPMSNVQIDYSSSGAFNNSKSVFSNRNGKFHLYVHHDELPIYIRGFKDDNILKGIDVFDLTRLRNHLLGIDVFNSIFDYIAADVNDDGFVDVLDLFEIQKVLSGKYLHFSANDIWKFYSAELQTQSISAISSIMDFVVISKNISYPQVILLKGVKLGNVHR